MTSSERIDMEFGDAFGLALRQFRKARRCLHSLALVSLTVGGGGPHAHARTTAWLIKYTL